MFREIAHGHPETLCRVAFCEWNWGITHLYRRISDAIGADSESNCPRPDAEDVEIRSAVSDEFHEQLKELGAGGGVQFLRQLDDQLSNVLRLGSREKITVTKVGDECR